MTRNKLYATMFAAMTSIAANAQSYNQLTDDGTFTQAGANAESNS